MDANASIKEKAQITRFYSNIDSKSLNNTYLNIIVTSQLLCFVGRLSRKKQTLTTLSIINVGLFVKNNESKLLLLDGLGWSKDVCVTGNLVMKIHSANQIP